MRGGMGAKKKAAKAGAAAYAVRKSPYVQRIADDEDLRQNLWDAYESARDAVYSIIPDYTIPGIDGNLSTIIAGLIGVVIVFGLMIVLGRVLARRRQP